MQLPRVTEATRAEHRRKLLEAATAEFAAKGFDGARVDDISLAAGLGKGTIYNYFESKHEVFREAVAAWFARIVEAHQPLPADAPAREQLLAIVRTDLKVSAQIEEFARVTYRETLRPDRDEVATLLPAVDPSDQALEVVIAMGPEGGRDPSRPAGLRVDPRPAQLVQSAWSSSVGCLSPPSSWTTFPNWPVDLFLQGVGT